MPATAFGTPESANELEFVANYEGPLFPVYLENARTALAATHRDPNATLGLIFSSQTLDVDHSATPNRVSGRASFFTEGASDLLQGSFAGVLTPPRDGSGAEQSAYVFVTFTGGKGRFATATGSGIVEADLFLSRGMSRGTIRGKVIIPPTADVG